jgi:hypothetical protein
MRELALHILDIAQNSVAAGARHIWLTISENEQGYFVFSVRDDGKGMDSEMLQRVRDPFVTSRTTRKVGMGIPFIDMVAQQCGGHLELQSAPGKGTELAAYFAADNIDRPPLGDIVSSVQVLLAGAPRLDLEFAYNGAKGSLVFKTQEVREILGEACDFANPEIYAWLGAYLEEQLAQVQGEEV